MDFTLDQMLTIIGRLDDGPGFDTPRERFRRFLHERITTLDSVRQFIQQFREHSGEQSHRALQDVITLSGRFLGFEPAFGRYRHEPGAAVAHGTWQARRRLHITLVICSDQTTDLDVALLSQELASTENGTPRLALLIVTPLYAGPERLEHAAESYANVRLVSLRGLMRLAALVADGQLLEDDVIQVFTPAVTLDARIELLERVSVAGRSEAPVEATAPGGEPERQDRRFWVNALRLEPFTANDVRSLIATRQIVGINPTPGLEDRVRPGDVVCVFIAGRGIVAHGQIAGILTDGSRVIRDSKRFTHVLRLTNVTIYDTPVVPNQDLSRKLDVALIGEIGAVTMPISPREFESITANSLSQAG